MTQINPEEIITPQDLQDLAKSSIARNFIAFLKNHIKELDEILLAQLDFAWYASNIVDEDIRLKLGRKSGINAVIDLLEQAKTDSVEDIANYPGMPRKEE